MHITIMKKKIIKKKVFFRIYSYMSKIFPKIYLKFDLIYFDSIVFKVLLLCYHQKN